MEIGPGRWVRGEARSLAVYLVRRMMVVRRRMVVGVRLLWRVWMRFIFEVGVGVELIRFIGPKRIRVDANFME